MGTDASEKKYVYGRSLRDWIIPASGGVLFLVAFGGPIYYYKQYRSDQFYKQEVVTLQGTVSEDRYVPAISNAHSRYSLSL